MKKTMILDVPPQLELLCTLLETTPQQVVQGFIHDIGLTQASSGSDERMLATDYFLRCGYGMHLFEYDQQVQMLEGLNKIRYDFYLFGNSQMSAYKRYAQEQIEQWFIHWKGVKETLK